MKRSEALDIIEDVLTRSDINIFSIEQVARKILDNLELAGLEPPKDGVLLTRKWDRE
jgi:hypothetical protein